MPPASPRLALWSLAAAGGGCARDPAEERIEAIRRAWVEDRAAAVRLTNGLDEVEQLTVIEQVYAPFGPVGSDGPICDGLTAERVRARCRQIVSRAHLAFYVERERDDPGSERACLRGLGIDDAGLDTPYGLAEAAATRAPEPDLARGLAACRCLGQVRLRDECIFRLAEALAGAARARADAVEACLALDPRVAPMCFEHTLSVADVRVPLDAVGGPRWALVEQFAERLARAPEAVSADDADGLSGFLWSYALFRSVGAALAEDGPGRPLAPGLSERLPDAARPHLRSAVAWAAAVAQQGGPEERARAILAGTAPLPAMGAARRPEIPRDCGPTGDAGREGPLRLHYLTVLAARRSGSADPEADLGLALGAARACVDGRGGPHPGAAQP